MSAVVNDGVVFPPVKTPGVIFGLSKASTVWAGLGVLLFLVSALQGRPGLSVVGVAAVGFGVGKWDGAPLRSHARFLVLRWSSRVRGDHAGPVAGTHRKPVALAGMEFVPVSRPGRWYCGDPVGVAVTSTRRAMTSRPVVSVVFEVTGMPILLMDDVQAKAAVGRWGDFVASLAMGGTPTVSRVSWTDVHWPVSGWEFDDGYNTSAMFDDSGPFAADYLEQARSVAALATEHRVFVTVTLDGSAAGRPVGVDGRRTRSPTRGEMTEIVVARAEEVADKLACRGFEVARPLSPWQMSVIARRLFDPSASPPESGSTEEQLGLAGKQWWPRTVRSHRGYAEVDGGMHAGFQVSAPQQRVSVEWLWKLLDAGDAPKLVTCTFEPRSPAKSAARVRTNLSRARQTVKRKESSKHGGEANTADVELLEAWRQMDADLAAGHVEVDVTVLAVLSAGSMERLSERVTAFDGVVRAAGGCVPTATWHQHTDALVAAMPFGVLTKGSDL